MSERGAPCRVRYMIECDAEWRTLSCVLTGQIGNRAVEIAIKREGENWTANGADCPSGLTGTDPKASAIG